MRTMSATHEQERLSIADLIERRRLEHHESLSQIARRAGLSKGYLSMLQHRATMPRTQTIKALARGLGTTERAIRDAAMIGLDMVVEDVETSDARTQALVASFAELDDRDLAMLQQIVETMLRNRDIPRD